MTLFDLFKPEELTSVIRQILKTNQALAEVGLNTGQKILKNSVEHQRKITQDGLNAIKACRKETGRLVDGVLAEQARVEGRLYDWVDEAAEKTHASVDEFYDRMGNPAEVVEESLKDNVLAPMDKVTKPTIEALDKAREQAIEVPRKLLKTAGEVAEVTPIKKAAEEVKPVPQAAPKTAPKRAAPRKAAPKPAAPKAAAKPAAKATAKPAPKAAAKPAAKPAPKAAAKPAAKAAPKTAAKPAAKPAARKAPAKPAAKPTTKPATPKAE